MIRLYLLCAAILSACVIFTLEATSQSAPAARPEFDAVSVRPGNFNKGAFGTDFLDPPSKMPPPSGGLFRWNAHLANLIAFAYDLRSSQLRQQAFQGLPKPLNTLQGGWFAIEARADGNPTRDDVRQMVRSMLEERFHLSAHKEKREGDIYALQIEKPGLGLKPHTEGESCTLPASVTDSKKYPHAYPSYEQVPVHCGVFNRELSHSGERRLEMLDVTMDQIANTLSQMEPAPVVDQTGLKGHYDAVLEFGPEVLHEVDPPDAVGAPFFPNAVEKELGLKLIKQKAQVDVFVIDHVEPPTDN